MQENYDVCVLTNTGGWKHGYYQVEERLGREVDCAICVKDPYAWIASYYNYLNPRKEVAFSDFAHKPIKVTGPDQTIEWPNPMRYWAQMNEHWLNLELKHRRKFLFRYEEVLADPIGSVQEVVRELGLKRREHWARKVKRALGFAVSEPEFFLPSIRLGAVPEKYKSSHIKRGEAFDSKRYTERKYLSHFDRASLEFVTQQLNRSLMERLGYSMIGPEELTRREAGIGATGEQAQRE